MRCSAQLIEGAVSHQNLLQWTTGENVCSILQVHQEFILQVGWVSLFAAVILGTVDFVNPHAERISLPFCLLWLIAPLLVYLIDKPLDKRITEDLSDIDLQMLRQNRTQNLALFR